jgi:hypothetical protein
MPYSKKAQTRTFRIDPTFLTVLDAEAEEQGITSSALINQILKKYALFWRFYEEDEAIKISHDAIKLMVELLTKEQLVKMGTKSGMELSSNYFYMMEKKDVDSVISFMNLQLGKYSGWYQLHSSVENKRYTLLLSHQLEMKWSMWLQSVMETFLKSILNVPVTSEAMENSVMLSFTL